LDKKLKMKIDILAIGAHPDDVELSCAGTLAKEMANGKQVAILDLTQGELGTRGTAEIRAREAKAAAIILGAKARYNLNFADGFFKNDKAHQLQLAAYIRFLKPEMVLCNAVSDRHPDHGRAAALVVESCFLSGLQQVKTTYDGKPQEAWRPKQVYHYIQWNEARPDFVVDISAHMDTKLKAVNAYASQFFNPKTSAPETPISSQNFMDSVKYRAANLGRLIGVDHAEGFTATRLLAVDRINDLM
jgi:bacillithiol biosynthesis deacetylase BshB1